MSGLLGAAAGGVRSGGRGYTATKHQREVGTGYFDDVAQACRRQVVDDGTVRVHRGGAVQGALSRRSCRHVGARHLIGT